MILQSEDHSPASSQVQKLIKRWWEEIVSFTGGDMDLIGELLQLNMEDQLMIRNAEMMSSTKQFMTAAFEIYAAENNLTLDIDKNARKGRDKSDTGKKPDKKIR